MSAGRMDTDSYCVDLGDGITAMVRAGETLSDDEKAALKAFIQYQRAVRRGDHAPPAKEPQR